MGIAVLYDISHMTNALPPEIQAITTPRGELIEMHTRYVGCLRVAAVPVIVIGLVFAGAGLAMSLLNSGLLHRLTTGDGRVDIALALFGVPFFLAGLVPVVFGCFMFGGRNTIELRDDQLIATHRSGPLRWRRQIPMKDIRKFEIKTGNPESTPAGTDPMVGALNVLLDGGTRRNLAWGYHKDTLRALADYLAEQCQTVAGSKLVDNRQATIVIEERTLGQDDALDKIRRAKGEAKPYVSDNTVGIPTQPADSNVIYEPHEDGLTITVPPVGMRKGSKGMLGFSIFWNGFMALATAGWLYAGRSDAALIVYIIFPLFWLIGIAMLLAAMNAGRRTAILDVVGDTLLITRKTLFKTTQQEVRRDNIQSIRRDASGTKVNDVPLLNLQVRLVEGKKISMLGQLSNDELSWIAAILREALNLPGK